MICIRHGAFSRSGRPEQKSRRRPIVEFWQHAQVLVASNFTDFVERPIGPCLRWNEGLRGPSPLARHSDVVGRELG